MNHRIEHEAHFISLTMADKAAAKKLQSQIKGYLGQLSLNLERWKGAIELAQATRNDHNDYKYERKPVKV